MQFSKFNKFLFKITNLKLLTKQVIAISTDIFTCIICTWIAFYLRLDEFIIINGPLLIPIICSIILAIPIFWTKGLYKTVFRYSDLSIIFSVSAAVLIYGVLYFMIFTLYGIDKVPKSIGIIQPMLMFFAILISRLIVKEILNNNYLDKKNLYSLKKTLIYGAGRAGRQLAYSLENNSEFKVFGFLDDDKKLHGRQLLNNKTIYSLSQLDELIKTKNIELVLIALPSISRSKKYNIINKLSKHKLIIKTLPSVSEIVDNKVTISDIKDLNINDLLLRDKILPDMNLMIKDIESQIVLVTGAGGSIGSELCRQIIKLNPKKLILIELNEFSLYKIYEELKVLKKNINVIPLLQNILDVKSLNNIFNLFKVDTVYHAAAYKHVPIVEENICAGIKNNVIGTLSVLEVALSNPVSNFVLISSDKAVRPTNIMGATKRYAELCVQAFYSNIKNSNIKTKMSIVRFGNVLESSGSVIPKFQKQIKNGGPITLTDPEVSRYFMTINEAAQLVIQAGAMSKNCEVFVLDMGKSIKIKDLIYNLVNLSGLTIKDEKNKNGDIEIKIIGLRSGEKLYEEVLLGDNPQKTYHPKIQKASDPYISYDDLKIQLNQLKEAVNNNNAKKAKEILENTLKNYNSNSKIIDHIFAEKEKISKN